MNELKSEGKSYQAIGALFGVSRQRVHQIISGYGRILHQLKGRNRIKYIYEVILDRDNYRCTRCGAVNNLLIHRRDGDVTNNRVGNLICLCQTCHLALHRPRVKVVKTMEPLLLLSQKPCLLLPKRAATFLGVTTQELYRRVRSGEITPINLICRRGSQKYLVEYFDRRTLIPKSEVERLKNVQAAD